jgi:ABC-2 type transport system permease protein
VRPTWADERPVASGVPSTSADEPPVIAPATELWSYRGLIGNLARRELSSKYKKSLLGWLWSLLSPALTLVIYAVVFGTFLGQNPPVAGNGELKSFALYLFAALVIWNFFNAVLQGSMAALTGAGPLLKKVYFPPACPAIANSLTALWQAAIEAAILAVVLILFANVSWTFLLFPLVLVLLLAFALGLGLVLSVGNVYFRDVGYLVGIGLQMLFYGTPMIYSLNDVPHRLGGLPVHEIIRWSPLTQFTVASRSLFYALELPPGSTVLYLAVVPLVVLFVGWWIFERISGDVVEEL